MQFETIKRTAFSLAAITSVVACAESVGPTSTPDGAAFSRGAGTEHSDHALSTDPITDPEVLAWLGALRGALAPYQRFESGAAAGWDQDITGCLVGTTGNMGHHYADMDLVLNDAVDPMRPEALLYEPQKNGRMKLVGVEFIIPFAFYGDDQPPPVIHGIEMHRNYRFNVWALHAWLFRHNPDGMLADWNPNVTCAHATVIN